MSDGLFLADLKAMAAMIPDGALIATPSENSGVPVALALELIAAGRRNLRLIGGPTGGLMIDMMIGASCVASVEAAGVSLGPRGLAPRFCEALETGSVAMKDSTCPATHAGYIAGEKCLPFMVVRGVFGSDLLTYRTDWKVIDNPFPPHDPLVVVPAILPEITVFHAPFADRFGNVWVGKRRELKTMARAAGKVLVTVEKIVDENMLLSNDLSPGLLTRPYINHIAVAARGSWPTALQPVYGSDDRELDDYAEAARTQAGFDLYLKRLLDRQGISK
jgi:glutaconate CoA-transferase subunit A